MFFDIAIAVVVWLVYLETAGKSLEIIDLTFARGIRVLVLKDREARSVRRGNYNEGEELRDANSFAGSEELSDRRGADVNVEREEYIVGTGQRKI